VISWSIASVLASRYPDNPWVKYGSYGLATAVSLARVTGQNHYPSDIAVGAILGYLIGHYVIRLHGNP
jgi:membrane-associated phospholipid phosphatase